MRRTRANVAITIIIAIFIACGDHLYAQNSWTDFVADLVDNQRIVYVSNGGTDPGTVYIWDGANPPTDIGSNPFEPSGTVQPFQTIAEAWDALTDNWPLCDQGSPCGAAGWILLRRGDDWETEGWDSEDSSLPNLVSGPSDGNGWLLIGAYGSTATDRPTLKIVRATQGEDPIHSLAIVGVEVLGATTNAIYIIPPGSSRLFIEDVLIPPGNGYGIQFQNCEDVTIRRSVVYGRHNSAIVNPSNRAGAYFWEVHGLLIEECVWWHNGWAPPGNCPWPTGICPSTGGTATNQNHNVYIDCKNSDVTVLRNVTADGSSTGWKQRPGGYAENNLSLRNPIGMEWGNNASQCIDPDYLPALGGMATHNVFIESRDIGGSTHAYGIWIQRAGDGENDSILQHNLIMKNTLGTGGAAVRIGELVRDVVVQHNVIYDWRFGSTNDVAAFVLECGGTQSGNEISNNQVQQPNGGATSTGMNPPFRPLCGTVTPIIRPRGSFGGPTTRRRATV